MTEEPMLPLDEYTAGLKYLTLSQTKELILSLQYWVMEHEEMQQEQRD